MPGLFQVPDDGSYFTINPNTNMTIEQWLLANNEEQKQVRQKLNASAARIDQYEFNLSLAGDCADFDIDARVLEDNLADEYKHYHVLNRQLQDLEEEASGR